MLLVRRVRLRSNTLSRHRQTLPRPAISPPSLPPLRSFFGMGDLVNAALNPAQTLSQLTEARRELEKVRAEMAEEKERQRLPPVRTFVRAPGYFERKVEEDRIKRVLEGQATFTVLFGASSTGKTSMLRQILTSPRYLVLPIDFRIAGFADAPSLYFALSQLFESFFLQLGKELDGYLDEAESLSLGIKHARLDVERRLTGEGLPDEAKQIGARDLSRLFELVQNALLRYWNWEPAKENVEVNKALDEDEDPAGPDQKLMEPAERVPTGQRVPKKIPVILFDEAHRFPVLISESPELMKTVLDAFVVLTKQERLAHIIQATSDSFYMDTLIQHNVAQHCTFCHLTDPTKSLAHRYLETALLPSVPAHLHAHLRDEFDAIYEVIGGKLVHWEEFVKEWVEEGTPVTSSAHPTQAFILLSNHLFPPHPLPSPPPNTLPLLRALLSAHADQEGLAFYPARRAFGAEAVDGLLRARVAEVRWGSILGEGDLEILGAGVDGRHGRGEGVDGRIRAGWKSGKEPELFPMTPVMAWSIRMVLETLDREAEEVQRKASGPKDVEGEKAA